MVTRRYEKFWFYSHDVIDRPSVHTYVHPSMYANVTSITLVYSIRLWVMINLHLSKQGIRWPVWRNHIADSSLELTEVSCFFKLTAGQVLVFDWIVGSTQVNSHKHKRGFIFLRAFWGSRRLHGHSTWTIVFTQSTLFVFMCRKTVWKTLSVCIFCWFQSSLTYHDSCGQHTGGYAVIKVKHRRDINLKLSVNLSVNPHQYNNPSRKKGNISPYFYIIDLFYFSRVGKSLACHSPAKWCLRIESSVRILLGLRGLG